MNQEGRKIYIMNIVPDDQKLVDGKEAPGRGPEQRRVQGVDTEEGFMSIPDGIEDERPPLS